jgi:elongation factor Ts
VDCKKALQTTNNDLNAALDWLREHGAAKTSSKVQGRETTEGLIAIQISDNNTVASIVRVSSETDFAGRSSKFVSFVSDVAAAIANVDATGRVDSNDILNATTNGKTVKDQLDEVIVAIRENISVSDAIKLSASSDSKSILVGYVHNKIDTSIEAGTAAAILEISPTKEGISTVELQTVGKKLAMHIVAAKPQYMTPDDVPDEEVQKEKDILTKQIVGDAANKTKSPEMIEKIVQGKLRKYYQAVCLLEQGHMLEDKNPKVESVLKESGIEVKQFTALSIN